MLVANKCEKPDKIVDSERGRELAEKHGLSFFETSAKTGHNVSEVFHHIAKVIVREKLQNVLKPEVISGGDPFNRQRNQDTIKMNNRDNEKDKKKDSSCCWWGNYKDQIKIG